MHRGTKPHSANVLDATGAISRTGTTLETEPQPDGEVIRPAYVKGNAAKIWGEYAPDLIAKKALTAWDVRAFARWCILEAQFQKAPQKFTAALMVEARRLADVFGMSGQQSRARIKTIPGQAADPAEQYFGKNTGS